ncbi:MAG: phosphatidylserine/phosphatidylglycerophosphate/cardiolipin synthase family protein [Armatimonadetes bacterium]|nr:phosphatidylserine/phosphatidylglycerophosphate/cardiolipin synthase family protein [Armatimonadota bacterium]
MQPPFLSSPPPSRGRLGGGAPTTYEQDIVALGNGAVLPSEAGYFTKGNKVTALRGGQEILDGILQSLTQASSTIQLEMYWLTNKRIVDLMAKKARSGVSLRVLLDPSAPDDPEKKKEKAEAIRILSESGAEVRDYPTDSSKKQINHVKLLIVDGKAAIIGGMNWGNSSFANEDADVLLEGPGVKQLQQLFREDWETSGGTLSAGPGRTSLQPEGSALTSAVSTSEKHRSYKAVVYRNLEEAKKKIHLAMYALTDSKVIRMLVEAKNRGVDVKVLLDPNRYQDGGSPNDKTAKKLREEGVPVRWYRVKGNKLHAKLCIFDDREVIVGSGNWTYKGLNINREIGLDVVSVPVAAAFLEMFGNDWKNAGEELP